ncbi:MAG: DOPA 4,5-dioxygenase family protein [Kiloniellaceae bacterium]
MEPSDRNTRGCRCGDHRLSRPRLFRRRYQREGHAPAPRSTSVPIPGSGVGAVGPHPSGSDQVAFGPALFDAFVPRPARNRNGLVIFVHPETGDAIADHSRHVIRLGEGQALDLDSLM